MKPMDLKPRRLLAVHEDEIDQQCLLFPDAEKFYRQLALAGAAYEQGKGGEPKPAPFVASSQYCKSI
jgi:hypothetical protein